MNLTLKISDIWKSYNGEDVLRDCSFSFNKKGIYVLMGPNGSGKSTFLRICALLELPEIPVVLACVEIPDARGDLPDIDAPEHHAAIQGFPQELKVEIEGLLCFPIEARQDVDSGKELGKSVFPSAPADVVEHLDREGDLIFRRVEVVCLLNRGVGALHAADDAHRAGAALAFAATVGDARADLFRDLDQARSGGNADSEAEFFEGDVGFRHGWFPRG